MSLDIVVMNDDESVGRTVSIGVDAHHRLMAIAAQGGLELLLRLRDYYGEGEIFYQEMQKLGDELSKASACAAGDAELEKKIEELEGIAEVAQRQKRSLVAIPD